MELHVKAKASEERISSWGEILEPKDSQLAQSEDPVCVMTLAQTSGYSEIY